MTAFTEWETPQDFYDALNAEFKFTVDLCAEEYNAKHENYFSLSDNALMQHWYGVCWMNPPYDRDIESWLDKAWRAASQEGATVVCLIQGRSFDTK